MFVELAICTVLSGSVSFNDSNPAGFLEHLYGEDECLWEVMRDIMRSYPKSKWKEIFKRCQRYDFALPNGGSLALTSNKKIRELRNEAAQFGVLL